MLQFKVQEQQINQHHICQQSRSRLNYTSILAACTHAEPVYTWVGNDQCLLITGASHTVAVGVIRHFHISCENNYNMGALYVNWEWFRDFNGPPNINHQLTIFPGSPCLCQLNQLLIPSNSQVKLMWCQHITM